MPRHVVTMIGVTLIFFVLLWFGVVILSQSPGRVFLGSLLTLIVVGIGITFSLATLREDRTRRE